MLSYEVKWWENCQMVSQKPKYCKSFEKKNSHWRKLSMIMVWKHYCYASPKPEFFFIFFVYIFIHISANMSPFGLKFSQMIFHTETSKLMYNWSFLFVVLHKPTMQICTSCLWTMIDRKGPSESSLLCCCVTPQLLLSLRLGLWPSESGMSEIVAKQGQKIVVIS